MEVLVSLAHSGNSKHKVGKDASDVDGMRRGEPQQSLQVERVQLADQKLRCEVEDEDFSMNNAHCARASQPSVAHTYHGEQKDHSTVALEALGRVPFKLCP